MKAEDTLYIKILIWAYEKQEIGFSIEDLTKEFMLTPQQQDWVIKVFRSNMPVGDNLFDHLSYDGSTHTLVITAKGTSAAVDYLSLQEAKNSGKRAEYIALWAIGIAATVGVVQIVLSIITIIEHK
jgi:hypothetical protein